MTVKTRFAPSPTGFLHIGGVRTALFAWLYAKRHGGTFVLRIEDTDRERSTEEAIQVILDGMEWLKLRPDDGPLYQTDRFERYRDVVEHLIDQGHAYRCYCSKEELDEMRAAQRARGEKPRYDGRCRDRREPLPEVDPVIRFRNPDEGTVVVEDDVHGSVEFHNEELDDVVLMRSDGIPTYNFSVVVEEMDMEITHVIRGDDHLNNTPRQMNMLDALGAEPPVYAHVPMILGGDGKRMSKRHGATAVEEYREQGILPDAMVNFLALLGWRPGGDREKLAMADLVELFGIDPASGVSVIDGGGTGRVLDAPSAELDGLQVGQVVLATPANKQLLVGQGFDAAAIGAESEVLADVHLAHRQLLYQHLPHKVLGRHPRQLVGEGHHHGQLDAAARDHHRRRADQAKGQAALKDKPPVFLVAFFGIDPLPVTDPDLFGLTDPAISVRAHPPHLQSELFRQPIIVAVQQRDPTSPGRFNAGVTRRADTPVGLPD